MTARIYIPRRNFFFHAGVIFPPTSAPINGLLKRKGCPFFSAQLAAATTTIKPSRLLKTVHRSAGINCNYERAGPVIKEFLATDI